jgi:hypothetical protein
LDDSASSSPGSNTLKIQEFFGIAFISLCDAVFRPYSQFTLDTPVILTHAYGVRFAFARIHIFFPEIFDYQENSSMNSLATFAKGIT